MSVRHVRVFYPDGWRYRQTSYSARESHHSSFFLLWTPTPNSKWNPVSAGTIYTQWENFAIFDWNRRLSRKRDDMAHGSYDMAHGCYGTLIGIHRQRFNTRWFRWLWMTPNHGFQGQVEYLKKKQSYCRTLTTHNLSNGTTFNDVSDHCPEFQGRDIFEVEYLRDKVTTAH